MKPLSMPMVMPAIMPVISVEESRKRCRWAPSVPLRPNTPSTTSSQIMTAPRCSMPASEQEAEFHQITAHPGHGPEGGRPLEQQHPPEHRAQQRRDRGLGGGPTTLCLGEQPADPTLDQ